MLVLPFLSLTRTMSFTSQLIPSIAGSPRDDWNKFFVPYVSYEVVDGESVPTTGTIGICHSVNEDLQQLHTRLNGNRKAMEKHLFNTVIIDGAPISKKRVNMVMTFLEFAMSDQPYFFLRKGNDTVGLYRKTRNYYYDPACENRHRIGMEFVRFPNAMELKEFNLSGQTPSVVKKKYYTPVPSV